VPGLTVALVTPESSLFHGAASAVVARSREGYYTVLAGHTDVVTNLVPGALRIDAEDGGDTFAVHGGFVQVAPGEDGTLATVLASVAERVSDIDVARAAAAKESAEAEIAAAGEDETDAALLSARARLARAELRLELKNSPS
jgi:F-type H+-transporting ATPase subunit epsilon